MGVYVVTGGTKGIGEKAVKALRQYGHQVINVDIDIGGGDISDIIIADLGTKEGREKVISEIHKKFPDGIDGLIANAGIAGSINRLPSLVLSVNYFGTVTVVEGLYDLLKKKKGSCAVTVSGTIAYSRRGKYFVDALLNNCGDEERIARLVNSFDRQQAVNTMYISTKIALSRWVRRSAPSWATHGVNINAVAPGAVNTTIMDGIKDGPDDFLLALPMPTVYSLNKIMDPDDIGNTLAYMVLPEAKGISGALIYCDGGTVSILATEKYY